MTDFSAFLDLSETRHSLKNSAPENVQLSNTFPASFPLPSTVSHFCSPSYFSGSVENHAAATAHDLILLQRWMLLCLAPQSCPTLLQSHGLQPAKLLLPEKSISDKNTGLDYLPCLPPVDHPNPGLEPVFPVLAGGFLLPLGQQGSQWANL